MTKQKRGTRTKDSIPGVLERVSRGESLAQACRANGISDSSFLGLCAADSDLAEQYTRARVAGADVEFEGMRDLEDQVLRGELDPQVFRVAMDARKWRLARKSPRKYGDRMTQELTGPGGGPVEINNLLTEVPLERLYQIATGGPIEDEGK